MALRSPPPSKQGRREDDDDDESRCRKKLEKGKEPAAKDADEEPLFDDNKFAAELLRSAFRKLEGVGEAFDIKAHHYDSTTVHDRGIRKTDDMAQRRRTISSR
jgi:ribosomal protein S8E